MSVVTNTVTGDVTRFVYNGDGARVLREDGSGLTAYIGAVEVAISGTQRLTTSYYFAGGQRIAMRKDGVLTYLHGDHLGSVSLATDAGGGKVSAMRYTPYGEIRYGDAPTDRRFTGQRHEAGLGLYDYGARYYDPTLGRFISPDTIIPDPANPQSLNRYAYTLNNPLKHIDVDGHFPWIVVGGLVGMAVAYGGQVVGNLNSGMELGAALTTNIDTAAIATGGLIGMAAGTGIGLLAPGITSLATGGTLAAAVGTTVSAACADGDCTNEASMIIRGGNQVLQGVSADGDPTNEASTFGELLYQFSGRSGGFKSSLNPGETEMSLARAADFSSPAQAFETIIGRSPNPSEMYRVTNVGTAWGHRFYPVYNSLQDGNPFGHVSLYSADKWDPKLFEKIFNPILFGPPQTLIPQ